jgi:hypothetical protein
MIFVFRKGENHLENPPPSSLFGELVLPFYPFFLSFSLGFIYLWVFVWTKLLKGGSGRGGSGKDRGWV